LRISFLTSDERHSKWLAVEITNVFVLHERVAALVVLSDNKAAMLQNYLKKNNHVAT
jgi:hypothetical protein